MMKEITVGSFRMVDFERGDQIPVDFRCGFLRGWRHERGFSTRRLRRVMIVERRNLETILANH